MLRPRNFCHRQVDRKTGRNSNQANSGMPSIDTRIQAAPLPSERELNRRSNPIIHFGRFIKFSLGIFFLARKHD